MNWIIVIGNAKTGLTFGGGSDLRSVVKLGNANFGLKFIGPFDTADAANAWITLRQPLSVPVEVVTAGVFASEDAAGKFSTANKIAGAGSIMLLDPNGRT